MGSPGGSVVKNPPGLIPGSGRFPREGSGNPLHYSCLENPMDRRVWRAAVHEVTRVKHTGVTFTFTFKGVTDTPGIPS